MGSDLACVVILLSPTEELATKEASYTRPTIKLGNLVLMAFRTKALFFGVPINSDTASPGARLLSPAAKKCSATPAGTHTS